MAESTLDVLIIGGGITGAGVAREAAMRGLATGLVERRDLASGTSSRSSKLIHGGIRYLRQGDVPLVAEAARERKILRRIAPHLAWPRPMLMPTWTRRARMTLELALWTFEKIGKIAEEDRHRVLETEEVLELESGLRRKRLAGGVLYPENLTDDARLVVATARAAHAEGALVATRAPVVKIERSADGFRVVVDVDGAEMPIATRSVVNAAGPWCDAVREAAGETSGTRLTLTRGIHLVVSRDDFPLSHMVSMSARDKRPVFAIPRGPVVYLGTTDTLEDRLDDYPRITADDVEYLFDAAARAFESFDPSRVTLLGGWAGLRPLVAEEGKKPQEISRKDEIFEGTSGMITVAGGKLTTYRAMAAKVVDAIVEFIGEAERGSAPTDHAALPGGATEASPDAQVESLRTGYATELDGRDHAAERLVLLHGTEAVDLLDQARREGTGFFAGTDVLEAEVDFAIDHEMAVGLVDLLERRLRVLPFSPEAPASLAEAAAARMGERLGWRDERRREELAEYEAAVAACRPGEGG